MFDFDDLEDELPYEGNPDQHADQEDHGVAEEEAPPPPLVDVRMNPRTKEIPSAVVPSAPKDDGFADMRRSNDSWREQLSPSAEQQIRRRSAEEVLSAAGNPRAVLGLQADAGSSDIRRAYHRLALLHHPDKAGDSTAFRVVADAYKALTMAKDEQGGWRDLDGEAVGPWLGHAGKVTAVLFDCFGSPPWEGRRLYTGCWEEGNVKCWDLSKGEPGKTKPPPRLVGEIAVGGFVNALAALSPTGLLTAQSAGMKPQPGESLRAWDLSQTPFRPAKRKKKAALQDQGPAAASAARPKVASKSTEVALQEDAIESGNPVPAADQGYIALSQMVYLHHRGVRAISLWPQVVSSESQPYAVGTVSKDWLGLSKIGMDGSSIEQPAIWKAPTPHAGDGDVNALMHESAQRMWTGGNDGVVKCWDVNTSSDKGCISQITAGSKAWLTGIQLWTEAGMLVATHSSGISYVDTRAGKLIRQQYTKEPAAAMCLLSNGHPHMFAGIGSSLFQYDTRCFADGPESKPKAIGEWGLKDKVTSINCVQSAKGNTLTAVGCANGQIACFDAS